MKVLLVIPPNIGRYVVATIPHAGIAYLSVMLKKQNHEVALVDMRMHASNEYLFNKIDDFKPEHLGQLNFYLEALDRDHRKPHENPSVGVLLCKSRDPEVVEYVLSRSLSPALVAEYQTKLIDKRLLEAKLHELYEQVEPEQAESLGSFDVG